MKRLLLVSVVLSLAVLFVSCGEINDPAYSVVTSGNVTVTGGSSNVTVVGGSINATIPVPVEVAQMVEEIADMGMWDGKTAYSFHIVGRRSGFTSTTDLNDLKQFDNSVALFPVLTGAEALEIVSTNASDNASGVGVRTVHVTYINTSNNMTTSSSISLNGTTAVPAGFTANEILWMEALSTGSNEVATGNITLKTVIGGIGVEQITAGGNKSLSARFMVPVDYTGYIYSWGASAVSPTGGATSSQDVRLRATVNTNDRSLSTVYHFQDAVFVNSGASSPQVMLPMLKVPALSRVKVSTISSGTASTNRADASFCVIIIHN